MYAIFGYVLFLDSNLVNLQAASQPEKELPYNMDYATNLVMHSDEAIPTCLLTIGAEKAWQPGIFLSMYLFLFLSYLGGQDSNIPVKSAPSAPPLDQDDISSSAFVFRTKKKKKKI